MDIKQIVKAHIKPIIWSNDPDGYCRMPHIHGKCGNSVVRIVQIKIGTERYSLSIDDIYFRYVDSFEDGIAKAEKYFSDLVLSYLNLGEDNGND